MLYYTDLLEKVFDKANFHKADEMTIISGYVGLTPIIKLSELPSSLRITVIYGMYGYEQIAPQLHRSLLKLNEQLPNVNILYSTIPIHTKIYLWENNNKLQKAFIGSANFTRSGLENDYKEVLADADVDSLLEYQRYLNFVKQYCIHCTDSDVITKRTRKLYPRFSHFGKHETPTSYFSGANHSTCIISLLNEKGEVSEKSGLNWCLSNGHVAENDAYIRIPSNLCTTDSILFPPKKYAGRNNNSEDVGKYNRENDEVEILWDDGTIMPALLEGTQIKDGIKFPKQISSSPAKSILGKYIRNRLGVTSVHKITRADLEKTFGHSNVIISLISEGVYYATFKFMEK